MARMFSATAEIYDVLYGGHGHEEQVRALGERFPSGVESVLDVGCAIGLHAEHFARDFETVGVDLDESLIDVARRRVPTAEFHVADAATLDLGRTFGAVVCLYGVIAYLVTEERVRAAVERMARHAERCIVIEPWHGTDATDVVQSRIASARGVTVARVARRTVASESATLDVHYLVADGQGIRHLEEQHRLGLFDAETIAQMLPDFSIEIVPFAKSPQGLIVATRRR
jgi:2-polyprenyl-3-methyl-5-hydroxy-6-metoxy-1,4-benzoquinol methylase